MCTVTVQIRAVASPANGCQRLLAQEVPGGAYIEIQAWSANPGDCNYYDTRTSLRTVALCGGVPPIDSVVNSSVSVGQIHAFEYDRDHPIHQTDGSPDRFRIIHYWTANSRVCIHVPPCGATTTPQVAPRTLEQLNAVDLQELAHYGREISERLVGLVHSLSLSRNDLRKNLPGGGNGQTPVRKETVPEI